jgi:hypothetical protein
VRAHKHFGNHFSLAHGRPGNPAPVRAHAYLVQLIERAQAACCLLVGFHVEAPSVSKPSPCGIYTTLMHCINTFN